MICAVLVYGDVSRLRHKLIRGIWWSQSRLELQHSKHRIFVSSYHDMISETIISWLMKPSDVGWSGVGLSAWSVVVAREGMVRGITALHTNNWDTKLLAGRQAWPPNLCLNMGSLRPVPGCQSAFIYQQISWQFNIRFLIVRSEYSVTLPVM